MNSSNSTDTVKTTGQQAPDVKKVEGDSKPAKVEEPKPNTDTDRQVTGDPKQPEPDDAAGKSLR